MNKPKLYLLNGALGAGKTTILKHIIRQKEFQLARIIENEFASYSVDTDQLHEHSSKVQTIAGVCICCSTGDELVDALKLLSDESAPVIIEATGMAHSVQLLEKLVLADMFEQYELAHGIYVLDALEFDQYGEDFGVHKTELMAADTVVITKSDLVSAQRIQQITESLEALPVINSVVAVDGVFDVQHMHRPSTMLDYYAAMSDESVDQKNAYSFTIIHVQNDTISVESIQKGWTKLVNDFGIYRMKGDFVDDACKKVHIEATPHQIICNPGSAVDAHIVCIGTRAHLLTHDAFMECIAHA